MKQLQRILYVTEPEVSLGLNGEALEASRNDERFAHIPLHDLQGIISYGYQPASSAVFAKCAEKGIDFCVMSQNGKLKYRISGETRGNVLLRKAQLQKSEDPVCRLPIEQAMLRGKIANSLEVLSQFRRKHSDVPAQPFKDSERILYAALGQLKKESAEEKMRGIEGYASRAYFDAFGSMIINTDPAMQFTVRTRRPPKDPCNVLLSLAYTALAAECRNALECVGLDPYIGLLHGDRPGKPALALDLMEELRPCVADRLVIRLINLRCIREDMFLRDNGELIIGTRGIKAFYREWSKNRSKEIYVGAVDQKIPIGLIPHVQAKQLADVFAGRQQSYRPYLMEERSAYL